MFLVLAFHEQNVWRQAFLILIQNWMSFIQLNLPVTLMAVIYVDATMILSKWILHGTDKACINRILSAMGCGVRKLSLFKSSVDSLRELGTNQTMIALLGILQFILSHGTPRYNSKSVPLGKKKKKKKEFRVEFIKPTVLLHLFLVLPILCCYCHF